MPNPKSPVPQSDGRLLDEVRVMLKLQDATGLAGSLGRLITGAGVCLFMGIVVASVMSIIVDVMTDSFWIGWRGWFGVYLLVLVPVLIWQERRSRDDYVSDALSGTDPEPSSRGEHEMDKVRLQAAMYASALVWGPRRLIDGYRGLRGQRTFAARAMFDRAAELVAALFKHSGGVPIKSLLLPSENMQVFGGAVDLLDTHGWIGKSTDGKSLWLNSTFRQKLMEKMRGTKVP